MRRPAVAVCGPGEATEAEIAIARELGRRVASAGWILLTGGRRAGVMDAAAAGAKEISGSLTVGILPDATSRASDHLDVAIVSGLGEARNNVLVLSSAVVLAAGARGAGTLSEIALAAKAGRPVIVVDPDPEARAFLVRFAPGVRIAPDAAAAIELARSILQD